MKRLMVLVSITFAFAIAAWVRAGDVEGSQQSAFSHSELKNFAAIEPIDTHTHAYKNDPAFFEMMNELHLHVLDICVAKRNDTDFADLPAKIKAAKSFVSGSNGRAALCTTFDPFKFSNAAFAREAIAQLDKDFADGAVAVKIWKNIGMELKDSKGAFVMPDNPRFEPIYQDIAAHGKTMVAHLAEPDSCWQPPNKNSPDSRYYQEHPEWYMYTKPDHPSKQAILQARDHLVGENPKLRVVGAHLGSMESDLDALGLRLDRYPNFAIDTAARVIYLALQPRDKARQFLIKYQDRILYATDLEFYPRESAENAQQNWQKRYATDWRFFATGDIVDYRGHKVHGLALPEPVLRKLYHENAVRWIPGLIRTN